MESYIAELEEERVAELDAYLKTTGLDDCELTPEDEQALTERPTLARFKVGDVFKKVEAKCKKASFDKRKDTSKVPNDEFEVPLVNAKLGDNGIMFYGRKRDWKTQDMCVDVIQNGAVATGTVYAQPQPTAVLWDAYLLKPTTNSICAETLMYLSSCLEKVTKTRFSYDKKATWERVRNCEISLPVTPNPDSSHVYTPADIDWGYMERYIRAMEKLVMAGVVAYKDKVIGKTKQIVSGEIAV